jgi:signal transduction histidine kinase
LALAALILLSRWPHLSQNLWLAAAVVAGLGFLAKPRGKVILPWLAVLVGLLSAGVRPAAAPDAGLLTNQLDDGVRRILESAERLTSDDELRRLFESSGEARDPGRPFAILDVEIAGARHRSAYLADDRGRLLAWGGEKRAYPYGERPLGDRKLGVIWSATGATLFVREPILVEGRLVGAVTVTEWTELEARSVWGMRAPFGSELIVGHNAPRSQLIRTSSGPEIEVPVGSVTRHERFTTHILWLAWLGFCGASLWLWPRMSWVAVGAALAVYATEAATRPAVGWAVIALLMGAAVGRAAPRLGRPWAMLLATACVVAGTTAVLVSGDETVTSLPEHLLNPGWGGVLMVALAWTISGWPGLADRVAPRLDRRFLAAVGLALFALLIGMVRIPIGVEMAARPTDGFALPRERVDLANHLPAAVADCRLDDLAPELAVRWGLDRWTTPSELRLVDSEGFVLSVWGDLSPAADSIRSIRSWPLNDPPDARLELWVATRPWAWLFDWKSGEALDTASTRSVWFAALTRSGAVAASLHSRIEGLDAVTAGELYHSGGGWARTVVDGETAWTRVWRRDEWLVAAVGRYPSPAVWVLRTAVASLWALLGLFIAWPPVVRREQLATFGGRLRLLVAGGVVVPLVILTLFLNLRLQREIRQMEQVVGLASLASARYTSNQLSGGFAVDDDLARWVSAGWGGEAVLFDGADVVGVSRPDLLSTGVLPDLPTAMAFQNYLIGRNDPVVVRESGRFLAAGGVEIEGRRLVLELVRTESRLVHAVPAAVDWLLTGALLAALLALIFTSRIEKRLSVSLNDLVQLARRLLHGGPLPEVRRPAETDLAEVLDAVRTMNEQVQLRESSLRSQEELLRITLSTLAPAVVVMDADGSVRFANPSAEQLLQEHDELLARTVREVGEAGGVDEQPVVETLQPIPGKELTWRMGCAAVPLPDGGRGVVAVVDDVTDVVRIDRLRQLNQLARIVAHEVKNPLTPIRLWIQELDEARRREDPQTTHMVAEACREILLQVDRLQDTANSFSNLVALEHWQPEPVDLSELVHEIFSEVTILERRGIDVRLDLAEGATARVRADRQWLRRAIGNLLKNSVDALGDGPGEIRVRVDSAGDSVVLEFEDTAGGIPEAQLEDLFAPHFSTTKVGSGLGLALVHQVISRCQGRVWARNGDRGLVVGLELPRL